VRRILDSYCAVILLSISIIVILQNIVDVAFCVSTEDYFVSGAR